MKACVIPDAPDGVTETTFGPVGALVVQVPRCIHPVLAPPALFASMETCFNPVKLPLNVTFSTRVRLLPLAFAELLARLSVH
jgi:hypothetical protein